MKVKHVAAMIAALAFAPAAEAHVKWFAPFIVKASPQPVSVTLSDPWFWTGIVLVMVFLMLTRLVEQSRFGASVMAAMDRARDGISTLEQVLLLTSGH